MELIAKLDNYGKPAWIALMIAGFVIFWPLGLAILAYLLWSGRMMGCWKHSGPGRWHYGGTEHGRSREGGWRNGRRREASSGNGAFDAYREETLRRLEDEQKEFMDFLERLRHAKDKAEFDQFMDERRREAPGRDAPDGPEDGPPQPQA